MAALEIRNLSKTYRSPGRKPFTALRDLSLAVPEGGIYGFLGPNGAGKSTTIKILVGLIRKTGGEAYVLGRPAEDLTSHQEMGYLPEVSTYYPYLTCRELLDFYCSFFGLSRRKRVSRIGETLALTGLTSKTDTPVRELSKGMQQRLGIAQAVIHDPPLLILDEPTAALDPLIQKEVRDIILKFRDQGKTIFFSSHRLTEVEYICDRVAVLHEGRLLLEGRLAELLEGPSPDCDVTFSAEEGEIWDRWRNSGVPVARITASPQTFQARFPQKEIKQRVSEILSSRGSLLSVTPVRRNLEDLFVKMIAEASHETG
ncbi:MAG: ABC transporter ATP-binding protein [Armatimonadetes bacterium]|nr:ABC transporter ATP-binding protein [Armatimonadota bacterium]